MNCFSVGGTFLGGDGWVFRRALRPKGFLRNPEASVLRRRGCFTAASCNWPLCYPPLSSIWPSSSAATVKCSVLLLPTELFQSKSEGFFFFPLMVCFQSYLSWRRSSPKWPVLILSSSLKLSFKHKASEEFHINAYVLLTRIQISKFISALLFPF